MKIRCHSNNYMQLGHERVQYLFFFSKQLRVTKAYITLFDHFTWMTSMAREQRSFTRSFCDIPRVLRYI